MDGWNWLDSPPLERRNELRGRPREEETSAASQFQELRAVIVEVLRDFPEAYRAVIERLYRIPLGSET
jgi:hypothetical protein